MSGIGGFRLHPEDLVPVGTALNRPECIIAERDGTLWISDNRSALVRIAADGMQTSVGNIGGDPNGIAMERAGSLLIANIGDGKLYRLQRDGHHEVVLESVDGAPLGAINFVMVDEYDRIWITVSTRTVPRSEAIAKPRADGYVILIDGTGPRIVADGFHFTNEIRFDRAQTFAYVVETAIGRIVRLPVRSDLTLGPADVFGPPRLFEDALIDGITFDAAGNLWVTEITRNVLAVIEPDGTPHIVFEDPAGTVLHFPTSLTFGGPDLSIAYVGSLKMDHIGRFRSPIPGEPLPHW
jgi:gluconolactonase